MEINIDAFARFSYHITSLAQSDPPRVLDQSFFCRGRSITPGIGREALPSKLHMYVSLLQYCLNNALDLVLSVTCQSTALFSHFEYSRPHSLHRDPVDGHRAADLAAPAAAAAVALAGIVALGDVVLVNPGNEAGVRPPAAIL